VPWAWAINGCASVLSAILATMLAMTFGTRMVVLTAALYLIAALAMPGPSPTGARR
jgi:L-cystine uptake protein TcyP (sodium:dicarboxylate symporter family)